MEPINWTTVILAGIGVAGTAISGVVAIYLAKISNNTRKSMENTEDTKVAAAQTAASVEKVHVAVNSERTAMVSKVDALNKTLNELAGTVATLRERLANSVTEAASVAARAEGAATRRDKETP